MNFEKDEFQMVLLVFFTVWTLAIVSCGNFMGQNAVYESMLKTHAESLK